MTKRDLNNWIMYHELHKLQRLGFSNAKIAQYLVIDARTVSGQAKAEDMITDTLKSLFAVSERYPELKADTHFTRLMEQLNGIESNIAYARQFFNDMVMKFNTRIQTFPGNIFANMFNFSKKDYFEIKEEAAREPVKVEF